MGERRRMGIEAVLSWAVRDELPKDWTMSALDTLQAPDAALGRGGRIMARHAETQAWIQAENVWGLAPDFSAEARPHPDALLVGAAVRELDGCGLRIEEGWRILDDIATGETAALVEAAEWKAWEAATTRAADGALVLRETPRRLVMKHALLRAAPCWECDLPEVRIVTANGKPRWFRTIEIVTEDGQRTVQEVDGYDRRAKRPYRGAFMKRFLDPDPVPAAVDRIEYATWRVALDELHAALAGRLESIEVEPSARSHRPWIEGPGVEERRVWPCLAPVHNPAADRATARRRGRRVAIAA